MKTIFKNYLYTSAYQIFILLLPLITLPYVSRVLLPSGIGINSWANAISSYFVLLAVLGLTTYGQREIALARDNISKMRRIFWEIEIASCVTTLIAFILYIIFIKIVGEHQLLLLIYSFSIVACIFDISWLFSGIESFKLLMVRNFFIKTFSILLIFLFVRQSSDIWKYVFIQSGTILISNISLWPVALKIVRMPRVGDFSGIHERIKHSFRFFIPQASISIYVILNKVSLGFFSTKIQTGYFDTSDKLLRMIFTLFLALSTVILPRMANLYAKKDHLKIKQVVQDMGKISIWAIILIIYLVFSNAKLIVLVVLGKNFLLMIPVLQIAAIMLLPMAVSNVLANQYLVPLNRIDEYTRSVIFGAIFNLIIEIPLIIYGNAVGAAIASVFSELVVTAVQLYYCRNDFSYREITRSFKVFLCCGAAIFSVTIILSIFMNDVFEMLIISIIGAVIYLLVTLKPIIHMLKKIEL